MSQTLDRPDDVNVERIRNGTMVLGRNATTNPRYFLVFGSMLLLGVVLIGVQLSVHTSASLVPDSAPPSVGSSTPAGVSQDAAVTEARKHVKPDASLVSASAGQFSAVYQSDRLGPDNPVKPNQLVWAVRFESIFTICPPGGLPCWSPRRGVNTVILDYVTGAWITTLSYSRSN